MRSLIWILACVLVAAGCGKKEPPRVRTACVLSDETGKVFQCFEQNDAVPREQRATNCNEYEAKTKKLVDGECPADGRIGVCSIGQDRRQACYRNPEICESGCKSSGGTFTP
jgi:hypothetical protein